MSAPYTDLVSDFPIAALSVVADTVRGKAVDKRAAALACLNVLSYAANQVLPAPAHSFGQVNTYAAVEQPTPADVDVALDQFLLPASAGTFGAVEANGQFLGLIVKAIIKLLPLLLA